MLDNSKRIKKILILSIIIVAVIPMILFVRNLGRYYAREARMVRCFRSVYIDCLNYAILIGNEHGCFQDKISLDFEKHPDVKVSWRFKVSIWMNGGIEASHYFRYDEPWNSSVNFKAYNPDYCWNCNNSNHVHEEECYWTSVMGIVGPDTAFDLQKPELLKKCENLIFIVSVKDSGVHWGQLGDIDVRNIPEHFREGIDGTGFYAEFFDGAIWFIRKDVPMDLLQKFLTVTEAKKVNRYNELIKYSRELYRP